MSKDKRQELIEQAKAVLDGNWTGHFTKPAFRLYPHQWSWDAAFIAIGYAHYDQVRAEQELRSLFRGQWANGMLPHIVFHEESTDYFPVPKPWEIERSPYAPEGVQTSGIVQPPNHASAAWHLYEHAQDRQQAESFLREMFPKLRAWHDYLYRERDPKGEGLVYIRHPWESGMDNSPLWDRALKDISIGSKVPLSHQRVDNALVDAEDRPTDEDYRRYMQLVELFRDCDYDEACIWERCPFLIQDVLFNTLLCQAEQDLAQTARVVGANPKPFEARAERTAQTINEKLWDEAHGIYFDFDLREGQPIDVHVAAGFSPLYAGIPSLRQAKQMCDYLDSSCFCRIDETCFAVPSYDRGSPEYSSQRYWRGPVWLNINWILYRGLQRYGFDDYANWVRDAIIRLPMRYGFYEYYNPEEGRGHGADRFSWTAALLLDVLYEDSSVNDQRIEEAKEEARWKSG